MRACLVRCSCIGVARSRSRDVRYKRNSLNARSLNANLTIPTWSCRVERRLCAMLRATAFGNASRESSSTSESIVGNFNMTASPRAACWQEARRRAFDGARVALHCQRRCCCERLCSRRDASSRRASSSASNVALHGVAWAKSRASNSIRCICFRRSFTRVVLCLRIFSRINTAPLRSDAD